MAAQFLTIIPFCFLCRQMKCLLILIGIFLLANLQTTREVYKEIGERKRKACVINITHSFLCIDEELYKKRKDAA